MICRSVSIAAVLLCLVVGSHVRADDPWLEMLTPSVSPDDVESVLSKLTLDTTDESNFRAIYASFVAEFTHEAAKTRGQIDRLTAGESGSWDELNWSWLETRLKLEDQLEKNMQAAIPNEPKRQIWLAAIAAVRRRTVLNEMRINQSNRRAFDPLALLAQVALTDDERQRTTEAVTEFEHRMDDLLRSYVALRVPLGREIHAYSLAVAAGESDPTKLNSLKEKFDSASGRLWKLIGQINKCMEDGAAEIAAGLETPHREQFLEAKDHVDYPDPFHKCPAELALEALRLAPDVAADKRTAVEAIFAEYQPARDQMNRDLVKIARKWTAGEFPLKQEIADLWQQRSRHEIVDDEFDIQYLALERQHPANPLLRRRHDLAIETVRRMRGVFTEDELQKLPLAARLALTIGE